MPGSRVIVANITKHRFEIYTLWDLVTQLSRELVELDQIYQLLECAPRWEEQSINREFDFKLHGSRVIVANITKHRFEIYTIWNLVTQLSRELVEVNQICQLLECAPIWEQQSINREFDSKMPGSRVIVANITKHRFEIYTLWDLVTQLSRELVERDQICQLLECNPRWEEQSINREFDSKLPGLRVIVGNITKHWFEFYTLWDLVTQLSRELVELDQICQLLECAPRWEKQSINSEFDFKLHGSRVIVANITKHRFEIYTIWNLVTQLSRELVEVNQICQLLECAPRWEEQSINRKFYFKPPGSRVIVANITKHRFEIYTIWDLVTQLSRELVEVDQISQLLECAPRWEEQSINREFDSKLPGSRVIVANITKHRFEIYTIWNLVTQLFRELVEVNQICQFLECAPRWEEQSINKEFDFKLPGSRVIVANITKHRIEIYTIWDFVTQLSRELVEVDHLSQLLECAPRWEEQSINREFDSKLHGSRVIVTDITKHCFEIYTLWDLVTQLSRELVKVDQISQLLECAPRWEEQSINREFDSKLHGSRVIVANITKHRFEIYTLWDLVTQLFRELDEVDQIC